MLASATGNLE